MPVILNEDCMYYEYLDGISVPDTPVSLFLKVLEVWLSVYGSSNEFSMPQHD